jgi:hypothetical protein
VCKRQDHDGAPRGGLVTPSSTMWRSDACSTWPREVSGAKGVRVQALAVATSPRDTLVQLRTGRSGLDSGSGGALSCIARRQRSDLRRSRIGANVAPIRFKMGITAAKRCCARGGS